MLSRGSPGWNDLVHDGFGGVVNVVGASTPQECCMSCINDTTCVSWMFFPTSPTQCLILTNGTDGNGNQCTGATVNPSSRGEEGGSVRCSDG
ncbi:14535_t:CDS:1, partial [Gigaspora rosea]